MLYLQNIVEQELAGGRLVQQNGYWRWVGEPIIPPGLVELIESRIGALPKPVGEVIDVLAVGEPIDLALLTRITDAAAVEEAETRGLITLEPAGAVSRCGWRIRSTARCAEGARRTAGCDACAALSPPNSPHPVAATTCGSSCAARP